MKIKIKKSDIPFNYTKIIEIKRIDITTEGLEIEVKIDGE